MRVITAVTDRSRFLIGTNPNVATGEANGVMIQMCGKDNGWLPGRITYYSSSSVGGSHGNTISQEFANYNSSLGGMVGLMTLNDYNQNSVVTIGKTPLPWNADYGLMTDRGILSRKFLGGASYLNLFEVKEFSGKAIATVGEMPTPWTTDFGLMVDRGILARKYTSSSSYVNLFEVKEMGGVAVALIGNGPYPPTPSNYGLIVERGILTERVRVALRGSAEWADFVFADNYKLMPLTDLKDYLEKERHLPDVPSADEVVKDGVDVGQMQAKLLQKIEELTLYVIQQQKEIDNLKSKLHRYKN